MPGLPDGLRMRPVTDAEFGPFAEATHDAFFEDVDDAALASWRERIGPDLARTLAVFDGDAIVATGGIFTYGLRVPGGADVACGGVTAIGVRSTHRRRGLLRSMMRAQLDDMRDRGEPTAALWASESVIYGRFGYGCAAWGAWLEIDTRHADFRDPVDVRGGVGLVSPEEAIKVFPGIYERARGRPGMITRPEHHWSGWLGHDPESSRDGLSRRFLARLGDAGYAVYRVKEDWTDYGFPNHTLHLIELIGGDDETSAALWRYLFDIDLVTRVKAEARPVDDPLALRLADPRRVQTKVADALWVRLVDVEQALAARTYHTSGSVVLEVVDEFCPWNSGRWRLEGAADGATCRRTDAGADLTVAVADLGAAYLGGTSLHRIAAAGRLTEHTSGAVDRAAAMFSHAPAPWCSQEF